MALPEEFLRGPAQVACSGELDPRKAGEVKEPALRERDSAGRTSRASCPRFEDPRQDGERPSTQAGKEVDHVGQNPGDSDGDVESPGLHGLSPFSLRARLSA